MLGRDVDMPHVSNSYFSARALVTYPERRKQLPPTDHYKQRFLDANCADLSFYYTLVNKLRADKMCKGCSPPPPVWKPTRRNRVGRLNLISAQAAAPVLPRERGPPAAAVLQHPRGQAPPVALGDDDGALEGQGQEVPDQRRDLPRDARVGPRKVSCFVWLEDKINLVRRRVVVAEERVVVDGFRFFEPRFFLTVRIGTLAQQLEALLVAPINLGLELDDRI